MLENSSCNVLCHADIPGSTEEGVQGDAGFINERIVDGYSLNWLIDGLPAARIRVDPQSVERFYSVGFELGSFDSSGQPLLNNHYDIIVEFHVPPPLPLWPDVSAVYMVVWVCGEVFVGDRDW
jgi:transmembrane 9 superfamily member 2/4